MKRISGIFLVVLMVLAMTSCSSSTIPDTSGTSTDTETSESGGSDASTSTDGQELVIWAWDQNLPSINYAIDKYKEDYPDSGIDVVVQNVPDTVDKMSTFFASGISDELPDLVLMDNVQIQTFLQQFPDQFANLSDMGFDEFEDDFSEAHWDMLSYDGSIYAFPFDIAPIMMEVNTDILSQAGVEPDSLVTWQDMIDATRAVAEAGYAMHIKLSETDFIAMMQTAGVGIFDENRNIDLLNPKVVEVTQTYMDIVAANTADSVLEDETTFGEQKVATIMRPAWSVGENMPVEEELSGKVALIPMPMIKNEDGYTSSANNGGSSFFILQSSEVKDAAYEIGKNITTELDSQEIALGEGLMPGYLPAVDLDDVQAGVDYYSGQAIWKDLLESSEETTPINVNEYYTTAKDIIKNSLVDTINAGTDQSAEEVLQETADMIASQTGLTVDQY